MRARLACLLTALAVVPSPSRADGPADNLPDNVRRIPKLGIEVAPADRKSLEDGLASLQAKLQRLSARKDARTTDLLPDVEVFFKAVHDALTYQEFFAPADVEKGKALLKAGQERADALLEGSAPWTTQKGLVVRGYRSKIDGSIQPYGLVIPESYTVDGPLRFRLDIWFHGRGETLSEVNFLAERMRQPGQFTPKDTIVLHPYGRYCNAFKFAGEVDVFEALESVKHQYRIDEDRISVRGFSMGGAACWQFAVHDASRWFAANPGAGFAETPRFLKVFQRETLQPTWYERKLWNLYDCDKWAANLFQCPTVAYSGELDNQKQAADVMAEALNAEGIELTHIIGPGTRHAYHPEARLEVERRLDLLARNGRIRVPRRIDLTTYTLRYNQMDWLTIDALGEHWEKARVRAKAVAQGAQGSAFHVTTENVKALTIDLPPGANLLAPSGDVRIQIDGSEVVGPLVTSDGSYRVSLHRDGSTWKLGRRSANGPTKRHGLQGPIDDAFMDSFVFVRPTGSSRHETVAKWVDQEFSHAKEHWRRHFRGEARVTVDSAVSDAEIASSNLILWGDPDSNAVLKRIADKLPIWWGEHEIKVGDRSYPADSHVLILIFPNPLNPDRYVVLNSSFTFREYDYLNNARQVPKLPDWAVIDARTPPDARFPGKVVAADFFGERWELKPAHD